MGFRECRIEEVTPRWLWPVSVRRVRETTARRQSAPLRLADSSRASSAQHRSPTKHRSGVKAVRVKGVRRAKGRIEKRFRSRRLTRFRTMELAPAGLKSNQPLLRAKAYKRSAKAVQPPTKPSRPTDSTQTRPAVLRQPPEASCPATSSDDTDKDRPPGILLWVEDAREPGLRVVRAANGPLHMGPFLLRGGRDMGRGINLDAGDRLNLRDAVALSHSYFLVLKAAFEQRLSQVGGAAVILNPSYSPCFANLRLLCA